MGERAERWSVEIFQISDEDRQDRILGTFLDARLPRVIALGARSGQDCFVTVETSSVDDRVLVRRIITSIDPGARRTFLSREAPVSGPVLA